ncbi:hypothetical protein I4U23_000260 [Adineta vaga]|nr:hypothetical protein I4U23_000260 [Adineta vaga]
MTLAHRYTIPIIAGDLRRAEFIQQLADTCEYMDSVSYDIFYRITQRLNLYRAKLNQMEERIQNANVHIGQIKDLKNATQSYSNSRYPVQEKRSIYKSIFEQNPINDDDCPSELSWNTFHFNETSDKYAHLNDDSLFVLKQYEDNFLQQTKRQIPSNNLGKFPTNIKSVVSLLKCNTNENPYIKSTEIDPLNVTSRKRKRIDESISQCMEDVHLPMFSSKLFERSPGNNFAYTPNVDPVHQLSLPDNLPDLDNYVTFGNDTKIDFQQPQITPSSTIIMPLDNQIPSEQTLPITIETEPINVTVPPVDLPSITTETSISTVASSPVELSPPSSSLVQETNTIVDQKVTDNICDDLPLTPVIDTRKVVNNTALSNSKEPLSIKSMLEDFFGPRRLHLRPPTPPRTNTANTTRVAKKTNDSLSKIGNSFIENIAAKTDEIRNSQRYVRNDSKNEDSDEWSD